MVTCPVTCADHSHLFDIREISDHETGLDPWQEAARQQLMAGVAGDFITSRVRLCFASNGCKYYSYTFTWVSLDLWLQGDQALDSKFRMYLRILFLQRGMACTNLPILDLRESKGTYHKKIYAPEGSYHSMKNGELEFQSWLPVTIRAAREVLNPNT